MIKLSLQTRFNAKAFHDIIERNKVKTIALFGSQLNEAVKLPNDFDFLVEFQVDADLFDHIGLKQDLEDYLGQKVDVVTEHSLSKYFRKQVLNQAELIYG